MQMSSLLVLSTVSSHQCASINLIKIAFEILSICNLWQHNGNIMAASDTHSDKSYDMLAFLLSTLEREQIHPTFDSLLQERKHKEFTYKELLTQKEYIEFCLPF